MQPINKQDVLIRLLKDGHISDEEFKALYETIDIVRNGFKELEEHEERIKPDSKEEYYMTVGNLDEMKAKVRAFENSFGSTIFPSGEAIAKLIKEPLPLKKRETVKESIPQGMHPKTWAFLNKHKN